MLTQILKTLFRRELEKLKKEIESYPHEKDLWIIDKGIANSGGNLCLHLVGNLNTYIGRELGKTDYIRNRDQEFSLKDIPRKELLQKIENTMTVMDNTFDSLADSQLEQEYPVLVFTEKTSTLFLLSSLLSHLSYHLGQINYHRRLLTAGS